MNIALIIAGGSGSRMHLDIPKQFYSVEGKPIIIYTLEAFQNHPDIDKIVVVCIKGWEEILSSYAKQHGINKLYAIIPGEETGHQSARKGVESLKEICAQNDTIIIHDAIRPLVNADIISDCIAKCSIYGNAVSSLPCVDTMLKTEDQKTSKVSVPRDMIMRVQTPQAYRFSLLYEAYQKARASGDKDYVYANTMMIALGETLYFSLGSERNMKITKQEDLALFNALLKIR